MTSDTKKTEVTMRERLSKKKTNSWALRKFMTKDVAYNWQTHSIFNVTITLKSAVFQFSTFAHFLAW